MGPFIIGGGKHEKILAFEIEAGTCRNGMLLNPTYLIDNKETRQKFYLGQHGSIFSAHCPGLVIASQNEQSEDQTIKLEAFRINDKKMKWKFSDGMIESVSKPGMFLARSSNLENIILQDKSIVPNENIWSRVNTQLLHTNNGQSEWKQKWAVSFLTSDYKGLSLEKLIENFDDSNAKCYKVNPAFSASFESFARELAINDVTDEAQCEKVRQELGFDKDHPFDVEVKANFDEHKCDPFFTGIDHKSGQDMEALSVSRLCFVSMQRLLVRKQSTLHDNYLLLLSHLQSLR